MRTLFSILFAGLFCCSAAQCQSPPPDTKTLLSILEEVRQLRQEIHTTAATVQRAQILIYRLRIQMDVVARTTERLEQARNQLAQIKYQRTQLTEQIKNQQEALERTQDADVRRGIELSLERARNWLEQCTAGEPEAQSKEAEYSSQLRLEQEKLDDLQGQLDRLDKKLEGPARAGGV
jgi:hypothetical protein